MRTVAVLCVARNSVYKQLEGVDVYDIDRDARSFAGGMPIVAHPPCRSWSAFCSHQAKPQPGERELALWCCDLLREFGGVLEQPAHSRLWDAAGLPIPGQPAGGMFSLQVDQSWWGYPTRKRTWLCFSGVSAACLDVPYRLHECRGDRRRHQVMSKNQRSATTRSFAEWLVNVARSVSL